MCWWVASKRKLTQSPGDSGMCEEEEEEGVSSGTQCISVMFG